VFLVITGDTTVPPNNVVTAQQDQVD